MIPFPLPAHRTGRADLPHPALGQGNMPEHVTRCAVPGTSRSSQGCPNLHALAAVRVALNQGPFPPPALPGFLSTTSPSATPPNPAWLSRATGWCLLPSIRRGFPCCIGLPSVRAVATTPAEEPGACFAHFPSPVSLPPVRVESASASRFSRPAQRSLALRPAHSQGGKPTLYTRGFSRFVASTTAPVATGRSESCRVGLAPTERPCLSTAHPNVMPLTGRRRATRDGYQAAGLLGAPVERGYAAYSSSVNNLSNIRSGLLRKSLVTA
jgi:hypothetical protein